MRIIVLDTSVFVSACFRTGSASRAVLRLCLERRCMPLMGEALYAEYEAVLGRERLFRDCALDERERAALFEAFLSVCRWTRVYFSWRTKSRTLRVTIAVAPPAIASSTT